jgi:predicted membrane-bound mannosyltransferase
VGELFAPGHLLIIIVIAGLLTLFVVVPFWQILKKAGFPPALSLLMFIPLASIVMLYVLAFLPWKVVPAVIPLDRRDT